MKLLVGLILVSSVFSLSVKFAQELATVKPNLIKIMEQK